MDQAQQMTGEHSITCAGLNVRAEVVKESTSPDLPLMSRIDLSAAGPSDDGVISLDADGRVTTRVGQSGIDVEDNGVVVDAGMEGKVGLRAGMAPMMQSVTLGGTGENIVLQNGQLPVSPKIEITAETIELSVGPNKITIGPSGITISGLEVSVEGELSASMSGATVTVNGQIEAALKGAMTSVEGEGMTTIKGGVVMIN